MHFIFLSLLVYIANVFNCMTKYIQQKLNKILETLDILQFLLCWFPWLGELLRTHIGVRVSEYLLYRRRADGSAFTFPVGIENERMTSRCVEGDTMVLKCMIVCDILAVALKGKPWRYGENVFELTRLWFGLLTDFGAFQEISRVSRKSTRWFVMICSQWMDRYVLCSNVCQ